MTCTIAFLFCGVPGTIVVSYSIGAWAHVMAVSLGDCGQNVRSEEAHEPLPAHINHEQRTIPGRERARVQEIGWVHVNIIMFYH